MALPTPKELKKLADACRKAGIAHFKCEGLEFTLDDTPAAARKRAPKEARNPTPNDDVQEQTLSEEELLFWSVASGEPSTDQIGSNSAE